MVSRNKIVTNMNSLATYIDSLLNDTTINIGTTLLRLLISLLLGLCVGAERQIRRRDAGMRTFTLICSGSCGAMLLSIWIPQIYPDFLNGDPGRIAAQVLTGIGFLGAGAIVRGQGSVQGLTTAACIWQVAVIGMAVGAGLYGGAVIATVLTLFVLVTVDKVEVRLFLNGTNRLLVVKCSTADPDFVGLQDALIRSGVIVGGYTYNIDYEHNESTVSFKVNIKANVSHEVLCHNLRLNPTVVAINMIA